MKKVIGSILCLAAIALAFGQIVARKPDTAEHKIQDWAAVGVLLAIGIALSSGKKKVESAEKK